MESLHWLDMFLHFELLVIRVLVTPFAIILPPTDLNATLESLIESMKSIILFLLFSMSFGV